MRAAVGTRVRREGTGVPLLGAGVACFWVSCHDRALTRTAVLQIKIESHGHAQNKLLFHKFVVRLS